MNKAWRSLGLIIAAGWVAGGVAWAQAPAPSAATAAADQAMLQDDCTGCHDLEPVTAHGRTPEEWSTLVDRMVTYGAQGSDADIAEIKAYLARTLPAGDSAPAAGSPQQSQSGTEPGGRRPG